MGREVRRVPLGFDWPLNKVWGGYLMPESARLPKCEACGGDGLTPEARAIHDTFYPHMIGGERANELAWHDKIGQAEVDNLVKEDRLARWNPETRKYDSVPRTAAEVNASNGRSGAFADLGHDCINRWILVRFRCERLGIPMSCAACDGHGDTGTEAQREAVENWTGEEPPTGEAWQMWETVSEGSPISPPFATAEELARWLGQHKRSDGTEAQWLAMIKGGGWAMSGVIDNGRLMTGVEFAADRAPTP